MSRAFISESDTQFQEEDVPDLKIPLAAGQNNYATPQGAERLRGELAALAGSDRPKVAAAMNRLLGSGSGPDRDELSVLRGRLREMDRRIAYLREMLARIEVVEPGEQASERVLFGATVTVREDGGGQRTYRIVGIDEADPAAGLVSWISPLAKALLSKRAGETVTVRLPAGESTLTILEIRR